jgi:hypothetical protein
MGTMQLLKFFRPVAVFCASLAISGCVTMGKVVSLHSSFDAEEANRLLQPGKNSIRGSALIRQSGGGVVTCAGNQVELVPATLYAIERMQIIYRNDVRGYASPNMFSDRPVPPDPRYMNLTRKTICDAQGFFKFENVADGEFFVFSTIVWQVGSAYQGGHLMQRVSVQGGSTAEIVLAP